MAAHNAWQEQKSWSTSVCFYPDRRLLKKTNRELALIKYLHNCTMTSQLQIREDRRLYWRSFYFISTVKNWSSISVPVPTKRVCDVFCAIDWFASMNGCRIQVQSTFTLWDRIQVQLTLTHSYTQLRQCLQPHRLQVLPTTTMTVRIRVVVSTFTCTDRIKLLSTFAFTNNSGTV